MAFLVINDLIATKRKETNFLINLFVTILDPTILRPIILPPMNHYTCLMQSPQNQAIHSLNSLTLAPINT